MRNNYTSFFTRIIARVAKRSCNPQSNQDIAVTRPKILCLGWNRGVERSGDARGEYLTVCPLPNSSIEECEEAKQNYQPRFLPNVKGIRHKNFTSSEN